MNRYHVILTPFVFLAGLAFADGRQQRDVIPGFEDPVLLEKVMSGQVVLEEKIATKKEFRTIIRAYFNKVSPEAYYKLATNHAKYPSMFEEVVEGATTSVSADALDLDYRLHLKVKVGMFEYDAYPEGHHKIIPAKDAISEARVVNEITNYEDQIKYSRQTTRLIPYQTGILIEDDVHFTLKSDSAAASLMKKKLKEFFTRYVSTLRKELQGAYQN